MISKWPNKKIVLFESTNQNEPRLLSGLTQSNWEILIWPSDQNELERIIEFSPDLILCHVETIDGGIPFFEKIECTDHFSEAGPPPVLLFTDEVIPQQRNSHTVYQNLVGWYTVPVTNSQLFEIIENSFFHLNVQESRLALTQEIKRSEYRYRDLLENASDFIFTLDERENITYVNNRFQSLTGFQKSDWMNQPFGKLVEAKNRAFVTDNLHKVKQGRSRYFEAEIRTSQNKTVIVSINLTPIFKRGEIHGAMGIGRDLTQSKKLEKDMHDLESFNESIIQSMESGLLALDLDGTIISLNQGGEKILGWQESEILGKSLSDLFTTQEIDFLLSDSAEVAPMTLNQEVRLSVKSGRQIYLGYNKTDWIDNAGEKVCILLSFRDISELKQMQSEVLRMDRLASLGVLASGIAHEIKNPLAGIKMMAQACEEEMDSTDERKEYLTRIVGQVDRLDDLLKTFFTFAKPRKPDRRPQKIQDIIQDVSQLVNKNLAYQEIDYQILIPDNVSLVMVDSQQMQQVFLNLILNAIAAMRSGGTLTIAAANKNEEKIDHRGLAAEGKHSSCVTIDVRDTGVGISDEKIQSIFDPFYTTKSEGMGLGLSIVYRIIQEHQGEIRVQSQLGEGTCFTLTLPAGEIHD